MGISLFQTEYLLIPVINNAQNIPGVAADALSIVIITRGATVALPTQPMSHYRNVRITLPPSINIKSAVVCTDSSDNIYLTAVDETFLFFKFDFTLTIKQTYHRRIFKGTYSNPAFNGHFNAIGSYVYGDNIFFGFSG